MNKKIVIYPTFDGFAATSLKNYTSYVQDARKVLRFKTSNGFQALDDVADYMVQYLGYTADDFVPRPY